jgi:alpha-beta hydrolase superfamily lysophospholipase
MVLLGAALALLPNAMAYVHARAMTRFASGGRRSARPEELSSLGKAAVLLTGINLPRPADDKTPGDFGLEYEALEIRGDDGIDLDAWRIGHSEARAVVVLFHGYAASKSSLLAEAAALHELGCETLLVNFRGSGGSAGNETTLGVYEADDVQKAFGFARSLADGMPIVLYGRSMGSAAVLRAVAVNGVEPAAVILECPFDRFLTTVKNRFSAMGLPAFPFAEMLVFWGGVQQGMNGFAHNPVDYARSVRCPALVVHGRRDRRVAAAEVESVFRNLAGEKQLVLFPEAGHEPYLATDAARWNEAVSDFLERVESAVK